MQTKRLSFSRRFVRVMGWTKSSYYLMSAFLLVIFLILTIWWPLAEDALAYIEWGEPWWLYFDWLLVVIFMVMSLLIMAGADLKADVWIIFVGCIGGLVIESWGTQTEIWWYYTAERPPMWIIPAWPIASLCIDRLVRFLYTLTGESRSDDRPENDEAVNSGLHRLTGFVYRAIYWVLFPFFFLLMMVFVGPTVDKSLTIMAIILVAFLILTPTDHRAAVLTFSAGSFLGYFLEYWGTTRECWTYYNLVKPPLFAVLAHGMAAVSFWRTFLVLSVFYHKFPWFRNTKTKSQSQSRPPQLRPGN